MSTSAQLKNCQIKSLGKALTIPTTDSLLTYDIFWKGYVSGVNLNGLGLCEFQINGNLVKLRVSEYNSKLLVIDPFDRILTTCELPYSNVLDIYSKDTLIYLFYVDRLVIISFNALYCEVLIDWEYPTNKTLKVVKIFNNKLAFVLWQTNIALSELFYLCPLASNPIQVTDLNVSGVGSLANISSFDLFSKDTIESYYFAGKSSISTDYYIAKHTPTENNQKIITELGTEIVDFVRYLKSFLILTRVGTTYSLVLVSHPDNIVLGSFNGSEFNPNCFGKLFILGNFVYALIEGKLYNLFPYIKRLSDSVKGCVVDELGTISFSVRNELEQSLYRVSNTYFAQDKVSFLSTVYGIEYPESILPGASSPFIPTKRVFYCTGDRRLTTPYNTICEPERIKSSAVEMVSTLETSNTEFSLLSTRSETLITDDVRYRLLNTAAIEQAIVGIWIVDRRYRYKNSSELYYIHPATQIFSGYISNAVQQTTEILVKLDSLGVLFGKKTNRTTSTLCPYRLGFDSRCGVNLTTFALTGSITTINSTVFDLNVSFPPPFSLKNGELWFVNGANCGLSRAIIDYSDNGSGKVRVRVQNPVVFETNPSVETGLLIAGCMKDLNSCNGVFNNQVNYGGFLNVPGAAAFYNAL